jgi:YVTN family beta-propeller protein
LDAYDVVRKKPLFSAKTGAEPEGALATADGQWVFVTSEVANAVYKFDVATRKSVAQVKTGKRAWGLALSKDDSRL